MIARLMLRAMDWQAAHRLARAWKSDGTRVRRQTPVLTKDLRVVSLVSNLMRGNGWGHWPAEKPLRLLLRMRTGGLSPLTLLAPPSLNVLSLLSRTYRPFCLVLNACDSTAFLSLRQFHNSTLILRIDTSSSTHPFLLTYDPQISFKNYNISS